MKTIYIGFTANNAIENDYLFDGSITIYPTSEKGNIYYSNTYLSDITSEEFLNKYRNFIEDKLEKLQQNDDIQVICFNKKAIDLCKNIKNINIVYGNNEELIKILNDKYKARQLIKSKVPILNYQWCKNLNLNYYKLSKLLNSTSFVLQKETGAGGDTTYLIKNENQINSIKLETGIYCISKYIKNLPINATLIIGSNQILHLPISAQLIKIIDNKFKYVGGDFIYAQQLSNNLNQQIYLYSEKIGELVRKMGYRGIIGIDYIIDEDNDIYFMEINPRFQSSSFLISQHLKECYNIDIATLHINSIKDIKLPDICLEKINYSFVNCNEKQKFDNLTDFKELKKGYFFENPSSVYRKIFNRSIILEDSFEKLD